MKGESSFFRGSFDRAAGLIGGREGPDRTRKGVYNGSAEFSRSGRGHRVSPKGNLKAVSSRVGS